MPKPHENEMMDYEQIKDLAVRLANEHGLINLSQRSLCVAAGIPLGSFRAVAKRSFMDLVTEIEPLVTEQSNAPVKVTRNRANPKLRKDQLLAAALRHAEDVGFSNITREGVAAEGGVSPALVSTHLGTKPKLLRAIMRKAIQAESLGVIAQGLAAGDKDAKKAPPELKAKAFAYLASN